MTIDSGSSGSVSASRDETTWRPSMGMNGISRGRAPVARMTAPASYEVPSTSTVWGEVSRPCPAMNSMLFFLSRNCTPLFIVEATVLSRATIFCQSGLISPSTVMPNDAALLQSAYTCALLTSALVGMQPQLRHTPPMSARSTTRRPSCAARMAATYPPGPLPMMMIS